MEQVTYTNKISYKRVLKLIEESLFKQHLETEINENMKNKIAKLILNPEPFMDDFSYRNGWATPKNGYISEEARKKARLKRKRKNKK